MELPSVQLQYLGACTARCIEVTSRLLGSNRPRLLRHFVAVDAQNLALDTVQPMASKIAGMLTLTFEQEETAERTTGKLQTLALLGNRLSAEGPRGADV